MIVDRINRINDTSDSMKMNWLIEVSLLDPGQHLPGQHPGQPPRVFYALRALRLFAP